MGYVRALCQDDVPKVANLFMKVFKHRNTPAPISLIFYFNEIFFKNPWYDESLPSLVYEANNGGIVGFLGVIPRRMSLNGRSIQVAVGNHFMVDPQYRSTLAGLQLLKKLFSGPQNLSMTDGANDFARRVWEGCGGVTSLLYSIQWRRPLRPSRYVISLLRKEKRLPNIFEFLSRPMSCVLDVISANARRSPFQQLASQFSEEELTEVTLRDCLSEFSGKQLLLPDYDDRSLKWLFTMLSEKKTHGTLRKVLIRNTRQERVGWYLYYVNPGCKGEVIQIGTRGDLVREVLAHLFYDAWRHGAIALHGRMDPKLIQHLSDYYCIFKRSGPWMLVHSNEPEVLQTILRGDAFLTRLEGEWWGRSGEVQPR